MKLNLLVSGLVSTLVAAGLLASGAAMAGDPAELAKAKGCLGCHGVDKRNAPPFPSYKEISAKYKGQKDAEAKLVAKVKAGGAGAWGTTPMPPQAATVSEADIKTLVAWVLSQK